MYHGVLVHVLSAIVWVGGMLFLALVVVPATRGLARTSVPGSSTRSGAASARSAGRASRC